MRKLRLGVLSPSEIACRRFLPALQECGEFEFAGIAAAEKSEWFGGVSDETINADRQKAAAITSKYAGRLFCGYRELIECGDVDCLYIPLPPALHYEWGKAALRSGKHVLIEKPFTINVGDTADLVDLASAGNLAVHENYMFVYHNQIDYIIKQIKDGVIGQVRLIRLDFSFPFRGDADFRYVKKLGGGSLFDCGGYPVKLASILLGNMAQVVYSDLSGKEGFDVDISGNVVMKNSGGLTAQISFGMDNNYLCRIEVFGSLGSISTNRIFTAPADLSPAIRINTGTQEREVVIEADNSFVKSIKRFYNCIADRKSRIDNYDLILKQATLIENIRNEGYRK